MLNLSHMADILLGQRERTHTDWETDRKRRKGVETVRVGLIHGAREQGFTCRIMFHMCSSTMLCCVVVFIDVALVSLVLPGAFLAALSFNLNLVWDAPPLPLNTTRDTPFPIFDVTIRFPLPARSVLLCLLSMCWCSACFYETHGKLERADRLHTAHEPCLVSICFSKPSNISETAFNNQRFVRPEVKTHTNMKLSVQAYASSKRAEEKGTPKLIRKFVSCKSILRKFNSQAL